MIVPDRDLQKGFEENKQKYSETRMEFYIPSEKYIQMYQIK